ncbi:hypothetical protein MRY87_02435 [bacterium]|nr:hypothetical protein [bacterium]
MAKKNVQVIDGAMNAFFPIYEIEEELFVKMFPEGENLAFGEEVISRIGEERWASLWKSHMPDRATINGIHGTLFCGLEERRPYFPTRRIEEPGGGTGKTS